MSIIRLSTENIDEFDLMHTIIHEAIHVVTNQYFHDNPQVAELFNKYAKHLRMIDSN